jgi:hypothetical protein
MGSDLADAYNRLSAIDDEEGVIKAKFKERRASIEQTIGSRSRDLGNGWTMENVECRLEYDVPNVNEVSYIRIDTGEVVKTRAFTQEEMQDSLPMGDGTTEVVAVPAEESEGNIKAFFGDDDAAGEDSELDGKTEPVELEEAPVDDEQARQKKRRDERAAVAAAKKNLQLM